MEKKIVNPYWEKQIREKPFLKKVAEEKPVLWVNENKENGQINQSGMDTDTKLCLEEILDAQKRWKRFAPYLEKAFPESKKTKGIIESPLCEIDHMKSYLKHEMENEIQGNLFLKCDNALPISGSIKARGGIYEVLKHAEAIALKSGELSLEDDYQKLDAPVFKALFSQHTIGVGSTGNLGLSIGIIGAKLGFQVYVHMSADAKKWKKDLLREKGVHVIEYAADYSEAVKAGRQQCEQDGNCYFVDDENSKDLFLGYAVAGLRLKNQLKEKGIVVTKDSPLFVYLPCGVGGGPGGVAYGLQQSFLENVHCFFVEPTQSPCMLLGMYTGLHEKICVQDIGLDNQTDADGLAVGRPSQFVGSAMETVLSGIATVKDDALYRWLKALVDYENIWLEPSALAGFGGLFKIFESEAGQKYVKDKKLEKHMEKATHIVWATGGDMVPHKERIANYEKSKTVG